MVLSIIIPTKDRKDIFDETLRNALAAVDHINAEVIVVNDSKKYTPQIPSFPGRCKLINNPNAGVASARNFGVKNSMGDILLLLDDDIIISRQSIDHILKLHQEYENGCFNVNWVYPTTLENQLNQSAFGRFLKRHGMNHFKGWFNNPAWKDDALFEVANLASFHLSISRISFEKTGGYHEEFPFAGFEDYDFPVRMKRASLRCFIDSRVMVFHNESDRIQITNWLDNWTRRAISRKVAVNLGYRELTLHYSRRKTFVLICLSGVQPILLWVLKLMPNTTMFDPLYDRLLSGIQAVRIFNGYRQNR